MNRETWVAPSWALLHRRRRFAQPHHPLIAFRPRATGEMRKDVHCGPKKTMPTTGSRARREPAFCTGHADALISRSMRGTHPQRRVARQHAIIRLDVMRPIPTTVSTLVLLALAAAGQTLGIERAGAQTPPAAAKTAKMKAAVNPPRRRSAGGTRTDQQPVAVAKPMGGPARCRARHRAARDPPSPARRQKKPWWRGSGKLQGRAPARSRRRSAPRPAPG
jgi:hypothetical protein